MATKYVVVYFRDGSQTTLEGVRFFEPAFEGVSFADKKGYVIAYVPHASLSWFESVNG